MSPRSGLEPLSGQRLAIGGGNTRAPARRPGRRTGLERSPDGGRDELRGLRVDDDVPAEQHADTVGLSPDVNIRTRLHE
jgi:hypothetical protein